MRRKKSGRLFWGICAQAVWVLILASSHSYAGTISLATRIESELSGDVLRVRVKISNKGTEAARRLQLNLRLRDYEWTSPIERVLEVGDSYATDLQIPTKNLKPGRHPILLRVTYTDVNSYPFGVISVETVTKGAARRPGVLAVLGSARTAQTAIMNVRIKNLEEGEKTLRLRWFLPPEINAQLPTQEVRLKAREERTLAASLEVVSALPGSSYSICAILESQAGGIDDTVLAFGAITVLPPSMSGRPAYWILMLAVALITLFILARI